VAAALDVRAALAAELRRLVRTAGEWPIADRRRVRNLLLDASTSDALPLAELLLSVWDDGMLSGLPERTAGRAAWDTAATRLVSDLQVLRFVEPGVARFVADAWINALGPDVMVSARAASPRPAPPPRAVPRSSASPVRSPSPPAPSAPSAASLKAYRQTNSVLIGMALVFTVLIALAFRQTSQRAAAVPRTDTASSTPARVREPAYMDVQPARPSRGNSVPAAPPTAVRDSVVSAVQDSLAAALRPAVPVARAAARTTDDIVLSAGRVFEGRVLSVRQQSIVVKDEETGLDFEIAKSDIDRIVTHDGRVMRFGADNVPLIGDGSDLTPVSHSGRYRVRYAERWGTERAECSAMAQRFAPGTALVLRHLRGAPMMKLEFVGGQEYNAAVRADGLFESGADIAPVRGPGNAFVSTRLSGRVSRSGVLQGVARLSAVTQDGTVVCDVALTVRGERIR
jgi:hypothetical protein